MLTIYSLGPTPNCLTLPITQDFPQPFHKSQELPEVPVGREVRHSTFSWAICLIIGHAHYQYRWEPSVCSRPRMEPEWHLQPLHLRHTRSLLHTGLGECAEQQRPWRQRHDWPLWGMSASICGSGGQQHPEYVVEYQSSDCSNAGSLDSLSSL